MQYRETTATRKIAALTKKIRAVQGGCLGKGTRVLMYDLTYKNVEEVVVGDVLMGNDSTPRNVLKLCRGSSQLFKVEQNKGLPYVVNDEHILVFEDQGVDTRKNINGKRVYTGRKHVHGLHKIRAADFFHGSWKSTIRRFKGIKATLEFPKQDVLVNPYYLGLWLGDGCSRTCAITNVDREVVDWLYEEIPKLYDVIVGRHDTVTTKITKRSGKYNEIMGYLKAHNLILNKHIPKKYIRNDRATRLALLAGLVDSDGCLAHDYKTKETKGYYIVQKRKQLSDDILLLCRSLGIYATQIKRVATMKRKDGTMYKCDVYTVAFFMQDYNELPVKIPRKKSTKKIKRNVLRSSVRLTDIGVGDYYGFELDGNHLFLLEDFTITHNTSASKTISILLVLTALAQSDKQPTLTSVVAESLPHLKKGALRDFKNILKAHHYWKDDLWSETDKIYTFETGSQMEFFGADQSEKLRGGRRDRCFMNEANNLTLETFDELEVRTKEFIILDWNPTNEFWFYTEVLPNRTDLEHIILTFKDNEACPPEIVASIEARKNRKGWYQVYGLGQIGEIEGKIYKDWQFLEAIPPEARLERYGLDFGYTNDPTAIVAIYYWNGAYVLDEILFQKGLSNKQIADTFINLKQALVVADSAEPKSIDEIRSFGINIQPTLKGSDSVRQGIQMVQDQKIFVTTRSVNVIKEYRNYLWETDRDGRVLNVPEHAFSHSMDAIRYGMTSLIQIIRAQEMIPEPLIFRTKRVNRAR